MNFYDYITWYPVELCMLCCYIMKAPPMEHVELQGVSRLIAPALVLGPDSPSTLEALGFTNYGVIRFASTKQQLHRMPFDYWWLMDSLSFPSPFSLRSSSEPRVEWRGQEGATHALRMK